MVGGYVSDSKKKGTVLEPRQGNLHLIRSAVHPLLGADTLSIGSIRIEQGVVDRRESPDLGIRCWCGGDSRKLIAFPHVLLSAITLKCTVENKNARMMPFVK
jgi:hypothetical protein